MEILAVNMNKIKMKIYNSDDEDYMQYPQNLTQTQQRQQKQQQSHNHNHHRDDENDIDIDIDNSEIENHYNEQPLLSPHPEEEIEEDYYPYHNDEPFDEQQQHVVYNSELPIGLIPTTTTTTTTTTTNRNNNNHTKAASTSSKSTTNTNHKAPLSSSKKNQSIQNSTLHQFFFKSPSATSTAAVAQDAHVNHYNATTTSCTTSSAAAAAAAAATTNTAVVPSIFPPNIENHFQSSSNNHNSFIPQQQQQQRPTAEERNDSYVKQLSSNDYPWSNYVFELLHKTFKIRNFRDYQKEIINCTLSGDDTFVIMRTGGGKSLTYQLPALVEGRSPARKITLVISPLLSLIRDQEEQMNEFEPNSAVAFTSGIGTSEQTRRWNLVRDVNSGICLVFVTPERVFKSNKLRSELEKLNDQKRLGRFVIDECHCACQWGHDFRPDYTKLGILKQHFPHIPLIAVTATASNRVREDCCRILRLGTNYQFFRSTANRPNLKYSVRVKPDGQEKLVELMSKFIKEHHRNNAGIIYTFSKKDANTVAEKLNGFGITARAYHSDVSVSAKESIHRSWMRNKTQVVVATIAFGLGINKPDVRFVLHHSLSKSLEAYYQESGRAGRDGQAADCVLYYSVKDVSRMIGMIHGDASEPSFWSMVRYAQQHGDDSLCRRIILSILGEPGCENMNDVLVSESQTTIEREVGQYAKDVVQLIQSFGKDMTLQKIVTEWRGKDAPAYIKDNPPGSDLNKEECERLIVALILADVLHPKVVFTAYNSIVYIGLKNNAALLLSSSNPKVSVRFPIRSDYVTARASTTKTSSSKDQEGGGWMSTKKQQKPRKSSKKATKTKARKASNGKSQKSKTRNKNTKQKKLEEVIDILDDSDDSASITTSYTTKKRPSRLSAIDASKKMRRSINSDLFEDADSECEFE